MCQESDLGSPTDFLWRACGSILLQGTVLVGVFMGKTHRGRVVLQAEQQHKLPKHRPLQDSRSNCVSIRSPSLPPKTQEHCAYQVAYGGFRPETKEPETRAREGSSGNAAAPQPSARTKVDRPCGWRLARLQVPGSTGATANAAVAETLDNL